jgi:DNA-binding Lrp family transcriptional regulator
MSISIPPTVAGVGRLAAELDDIDRAIIRELTADGRLSIRTLAERVRISRTNAYARVERLMAEGVVTGFTARVDPGRVGLGTTAYILLSTDQNAWREVSAQLREVPYVQHVALVGGDVDMLVLVRAPDNAALRDIVLGRIHTVAGVRSTRTWLVFDEVAGSDRFR